MSRCVSEEVVKSIMVYSTQTPKDTLYHNFTITRSFRHIEASRAQYQQVLHVFGIEAFSKIEQRSYSNTIEHRNLQHGFEFEHFFLNSNWNMTHPPQRNLSKRDPRCERHGPFPDVF